MTCNLYRIVYMGAWVLCSHNIPGTLWLWMCLHCGGRLHPIAFRHLGGFHPQWKYSMMMLTMSRIVSLVMVLSRMEGHANKVFR